MFKWLFSGTERRRRREEEREFIDLVIGDARPMKFCFSSGGGKATTIKVDEAGEKLHLMLQRKLRPSDLRDGKLIPTAAWEIVPRGGKLLTHLGLTYRTAEELHKMLGEALKDAHRKQRRAMFHKRMTELVFSVFATHIRAQ